MTKGEALPGDNESLGGSGDGGGALDVNLSNQIRIIRITISIISSCFAFQLTCTQRDHVDRITYTLKWICFFELLYNLIINQIYETNLN